VSAKRILDIALSVGGLLLLSPLYALIAILIKAEDGGPVFFSQRRIGRGGAPFTIWKFRTMVPHAERFGGQLTTSEDHRITRVGARLRERKLDELPQLLNVLLGEMTLVGPRPEVSRYVTMYGSEQLSVLDLVPGVTDRASILFADEGDRLAKSADPERLYIEHIMPEKIRVNLEYARNATVLNDLRVMLETVRRLFGQQGADITPSETPGQDRVAAPALD
jgi:lipopolysaccharide/colanic/teichoic acid biosynthesis glycosyltransferase